MIPNLLYCLIPHQLRTYEMLNIIVNPSNNLCIVCFPCIYQSSIPLISIPRYHISSTNISPHFFTLKNIYHYITPIRIIILSNLTLVAHVRTSQRFLHSIHIYLGNQENRADKGFLSFIIGERKWESSPSIWSLGILIGLKDQVWGLVT